MTKPLARPARPPRAHALVKPIPSGSVPIDRPAQLRALASPLRQELLDVLETAGPCAIAELGERLARAPDALYFHVRRLVKVGLVVEVERRQEGRHAFVVYDVIGRPLRIDRSRAKAKDVQGVVAGILRLAARDYRRGLADAATVVDGSARNHWGARVRGWMDERGLARTNQLLEELGALFRAGKPGAGCQPVALAWVLAPVPASRAAPRGVRSPASGAPLRRERVTKRSRTKPTLTQPSRTRTTRT